MFEIPVRLRKKQLGDLHLSEKNKKTLSLWLQRPTSILVLMGPDATGKSSTLAAISNFFERVPCRRFISEPDFLDALKAAEFSAGAELKCWSEADVFCLDEWLQWSNTEWQEKQVERLIKLRIDAGRPTILATNLSFSEINEKLGRMAPMIVNHIRAVFLMMGDQCTK